MRNNNALKSEKQTIENAFIKITVSLSQFNCVSDVANFEQLINIPRPLKDCSPIKHFLDKYVWLDLIDYQ